MAQYRRTLARVLDGSADAAIRFQDLRHLLLRLGFTERIRGGHHTYRHPRTKAKLVLTRHEAMTPVYQVRQVRDILQTYGLAEAQDG